MAAGQPRSPRQTSTIRRRVPVTDTATSYPGSKSQTSTSSAVIWAH